MPHEQHEPEPDPRRPEKLDLRAKWLLFADGSFHCRLEIGVSFNVADIEVLDETDPKPTDPVPKMMQTVPLVARAAIVRGPRGVEQKRVVLHSAGQQADRVERKGEREDAAAADRVIGGLQTDDPTRCCRVTNGPARISPNGRG